MSILVLRICYLFNIQWPTIGLSSVNKCVDLLVYVSAYSASFYLSSVEDMLAFSLKDLELGNLLWLFYLLLLWHYRTRA